MIIFEKIIIEGFGSIQGPFIYTLDRVGINLILGENGVGKTTILNALSWCLYKQNIKKGSNIEPWESVQGKKYRGTMVSVNYRDGKNSYQVTRCKDFKGNIGKPNQKGGNKLFFFKDGELPDMKYKSNIQPLIEKSIGYSFNLFKNAILFGQEVERLMKESGPNKRAVFEEAFDTSFIEDARSKVITRLNNKEREEFRLRQNQQSITERLKDFDIDTLHLMNQLDKNIQSAKRQRKDSLEAIADLGNDMEDTLKKLVAQIGEVKRRLEKYQNKIDPKLTDEEFKLNMWINGRDQDIETLKDIKKELLNKYSKAPTICDKCKQPLPRKSRNKYRDSIKEELGRLKKKMASLLKEHQDLSNQYARVKSQIGKQEKYKSLVRDLKLALQKLEDGKERLMGKINMAELIKTKQLPRLEKNIQKLKKEQRVLKEGRHKEKQVIEQKLFEADSELQHIKGKNEIDRWLVKDPLSPNGLRAYIFNSNLDTLNKHLAKYHVKIGFSIKVYIDLQNTRKDIGININKGGQIVPYEDLSKGQKQLTDAILALAVNDTITENKPINIFLMDEVFESLSKNNVEIIGNIIMEKSKDLSIHIITHLPSFQPIGARKVTLALNKAGNTVKVGE